MYIAHDAWMQAVFTVNHKIKEMIMIHKKTIDDLKEHYVDWDGLLRHLTIDMLREAKNSREIKPTLLADSAISGITYFLSECGLDEKEISEFYKSL